MNKNRIKKILIVDDDKDWRDFSTAALEDDYFIETAANGEEALQKISSLRPDLIVLDVMMPGGIDGFTTLCRLKEDPITSDTAIIMLSEINTIMDTEFDKETISQYLKQSPSAFLEKPVKIDLLTSTVKELLKG